MDKKSYYQGMFMSKEKILVVDDDSEIRELIAKYLKKEDMVITEAENGQKALSLIKKNNFDLVILDIMMDGMDGFDVLRNIRLENDILHVMILSAREEDYDKVLGLGLGADDYITKPFSPSELIARIKSHLRRQKFMTDVNKKNSNIVKSGVFEIDFDSYNVTKNGIKLELSAREINILKLFMENPDRVYTKQQIYENVWEDKYFDENSVTVYIRHLREKIEDNPNKPEFIITVWGLGYKYISKGADN
jgi:DNA-binding response OmpR family regulator